MKYIIEFTPKAWREFNKLPDDVQDRLERRLDKLAQRPRPPGMIKLEDAEDLYRIRVGDYRIIYRIEDRILLILVVKVGHRKDVYRVD